MDIIVRDGTPYVAFTPERIEAIEAVIKAVGGNEILQSMVDEAELQISWELATYIDAKPGADDA